MKTQLISLAIAAACLALLGATPVRLRAATITVTTTADSGAGSLRTALTNAANGDTINCSVTGTIMLSSGQLTVPRSVTIMGPGSATLTVSGTSTSRVFNVTGTNVTISGLRIANGGGTNSGAGIYTGGSPGSAVAVSNCDIADNNTTRDGGGIFNGPGVTMTISNCTLSGNRANGSGGAIFNDHATLTVLASTISWNQVGTHAAGIYNNGLSGSASLTLNACTFSGNAANLLGGGIMSDGASSGSATLTISACTFSGNSAWAGGAILNYGQSGSAILKINACTFSGNSAGYAGANIDNSGWYGTAALEIGDTILNAGAAGGNIFNDLGTVTSAGYNLSSDNGGGFLTATGDRINTDPMLGPLQDNGGPTLTHALLPGSPAIDAGKTNAIPALARNTDQRGFPRADNPTLANATGGDGSDIGAFEAQFNTALSFDGTNDYVRAAVPRLASNYTVSAWVFLRAGGNLTGTRMAVLSATNCGGSAEVLIRSQTSLSTDPQYLELARCGAFSGTNSTGTVPLNQWVHVAVSVSSTRQVSYFINGSAAGAWTATGDVSLGPNITLGDNNNSRRFNGMLDEVQIWNRSRSQAEILADMTHPLTGAESNLVAYWRLNDGAGTTACDASPNHCDGTLTNGPAWVGSGVPWWAPHAATLAATNVTMPSATLQGSVNPNGTNTGAWFEWGTTTHYGLATAVTNLGGGTDSLPVQSVLTDLVPGTSYHYRLVATNRFGTTLGQDRVVTPPPPAVVQTLPAVNLSLTNGVFRATLQGTVNPKGQNTEAWFEWGSGTNYSYRTEGISLGSGSSALAVSNILTGAWSGEINHFRAVASNALGVTTGPEMVLWPLWGAALVFDGVGDHGRVEDNSCCSEQVSPLRVTNLTLEGWVNFASLSGAPHLFAKPLGGTTNHSYAVWYQNGALHARCGSGPALNYPWAPALGHWVHVAYVVDGAAYAQTLYVDAVPVATDSTAGSPLYDWHPFLIGAGMAYGNATNYFQGFLDEVRIWNVARSAAQIQADYIHPLTGTEAGLLACWRFDDAAGATARDASANHLDATLVNNPAWTITQPTLSTIPDLTIGQGNWTAPLPFTVADSETPPEQLAVAVRSYLPALVPNTPEALILGGSGTQHTLQIAPTPTALGTATIAVTVTDSRESAAETFDLTVVPGPRLSEFADLIIGQDTNTWPIAFTVEDPDTPADQLTVTVISQNPGLVPNTPDALILTGSGTQRTLTVVPVPNATGSATIIVTASDGLSTDRHTFTLAVKARPVVSGIPDQTILQGGSTFALPFTVSDPDTPADQLIVTAGSANPFLVPNTPGALILGGAGSDRTLRVVPAPGGAGAAVITVSATDGVGVGTASFTVRVLGAPSLSPIPNQVLNQGESTGPLPFTVSDSDTPAENLTLQAVSSNPVLVPNDAAHLGLGGYGGNRSLTVFPNTNHSGSAVITVTARDGTNTGRTSFTLTVRPRLGSPLLSITSAEPVPPQTWRFRFRDAGTDATNYTLEYISDLSPTNVWANAPSTAITNEGGGTFRVDTVPPPGESGFFRVKGFRLVMANFASSGVTVDEGAGTVSAVVVFTKPFLGTLRYTVSGTAGTNDYGALSGVVLVNGSTAVIPVTLADNASLGQLKYLTLTLQGGPGFSLGLATATTLTIEENDAEWQGRLLLLQGVLTGQTNQVIWWTNQNGTKFTNLTFLPLNTSSALDFVLRIQRSGGACQGALKGNPSGFFPTNAAPVDLTFTENAFSAQALDMLLPALNTSPLLDSPFYLTLRLEAANGQPDQNVSSNQVQGVASLRLHLPDKPHLDTTNLGTFLLLKPAPPPPTNEVRLATEQP